MTNSTLYWVRYRLITVFTVIVFAAWCGGAIGTRAQESIKAAVQYDVTFAGLPSRALDDQVKAASQLVRLIGSPPASVLGLRRRLRADIQRINEILKSEGYYGARVVPSLTRPTDPDATSEKTQVSMTVMPGPRYSFAAPSVRLEPDVDHSPEAYDAPVAALEGLPARAASAVTAEGEVIKVFENAGYPFARALPRRAEVDHARTAIRLSVAVDPGSYRGFGTPVYSGLETVQAAYLERLVPWRVGEAFDRSALTNYRQSLIDTRLFTSVKVEPLVRTEADRSAPLDVAVSVQEGSLRTIGASVSYARDEGFGGGVSWQHRNFLGQAETLDLKADASELNQSVSAGLTKPAFRRPDQVLSTSIVLLHEDSDAFEEYSATAHAGLERDLWSDWRGGLGVSLEAAELTDVFGVAQSYLIGVPLHLFQDHTDSELDPKRGHRLDLEVTPYFGEFTGTALFTQTSVTGSYYYPVSDAPRPVVLAARLKLGSVLGESSRDIPANKRFYAGGGGSVRGFKYQTIGVLDAGDSPRGGRSVIEAGLEARIPISDSLSIVPFIDGGLVSQDVVPSFSETMRFGAGLGGRYETPVGPLRVDIALPVNRRAGVDDSFQFYISFGQAF